MLGINSPNEWKKHVGNFLVVWGGQLAYKLGELLFLQRFPTPFELYASGVGSLIATLAFYGINKMKSEAT